MTKKDLKKRSLKKINIEVLHHFHYFERDLFLLKIDNDNYTTVYRGSGLNGGRKGRVLPYSSLHSGPLHFGDIRSGIVQGYIYKEFYIDSAWRSHKKNLNRYAMGTAQFADIIEEKLENYDSTNSEKYESEEDYNNIKKIAKKINTEFKNKVKELKLKNFDWIVLGRTMEELEYDGFSFN
jgi:hypothetical protein